jgi:uncharacterized membrane protein YedE/YeeE
LNSIAIILAQSLHLTNCQPRTPNSLGLNLLKPYDGNLLGGALLGLGMALTGACPGTVLPQVATGVPSAPLVLLGSVLGGVVYSRWGKGLQVTATATATVKGDEKDQANGDVKEKEKEKEVEKRTIYEKFGWGKASTVVGYEVLCLSIVAGASYFFPGHKGEGLVPAIPGGLLIGLTQFTSLALTSNTLGVSTAYEQIGDLFWSLSSSPRKVPNIKSTAFAAGTLLGSWGLSRVVRIPIGGEVAVELGVVRALLGGVALVFGARLAGGCTSGHGISGMSQLSISSLVTVAAMFGSGAFFSFFF